MPNSDSSNTSKRIPGKLMKLFENTICFCLQDMEITKNTQDAFELYVFALPHTRTAEEAVAHIQTSLSSEQQHIQALLSLANALASRNHSNKEASS